MESLKNKKIAILGFGQEGQALAHYFNRHNILFDVLDKNLTELPENTGHLVNGASYLDNLDNYDIIFRSPGFYRNDENLLLVEKKGKVISSQTKFFFDNYPGVIIGITGTKGKGTTSSLIYHFITKAKKDNAVEKESILEKSNQIEITGNIGYKQPVDFLDDTSEKSLIVYELSSFQLQDLDKSPHIAVVLMITEDHLDVHKNLDEYHSAKANIVKYQSNNDFCIYNEDYPITKQIVQQAQSQKIAISKKDQENIFCVIKPDKLIFKHEDKEYILLKSLIPLLGDHNSENVAAAVLAALLVGVKFDAIIKYLPDFKPLRHRLEKVHEYNGISFYDDSISTNPDTTIAAIDAFKNPINLIIGGYNKGLNYQPLLKHINQKHEFINSVICIGQASLLLKNELLKLDYNKNLQAFDNLEQAFDFLKTVTRPGHVILFSPGFASFDSYKNYKERGEHFTKLAKNWGYEN